MRRPCDHCGTEFEARNGAARFCRDRCRKAHKRAESVRVPVGTPTLTTVAPRADDAAANPESGAMARMTWRDLSRMGLADDIGGLLALVLAREIDNGPHTGAALSALTREFSRVWAAVKAAATPATETPLDRIRRQRDQRRARGEST